MKKIFSLIMLVCMIFTFGITVSAAEDGQVPKAAQDTSHFSGEISEEAVLNGGLLRSTSLPTSGHDLGGGAYYADLEWVQAGWLYTNKYFKPNTNGEIYVDYDVATDGTWGSMRIGFYDMSAKKMVATWDTDEFGISGIRGSIYCYNLDTSKNYAVAFISIRSGMGSIPRITGDATIYW